MTSDYKITYQSLFPLLLLIVLSSSSTGFAAPDRGSSDKVIRIGFNKDFAPFEFTNNDGVPDGYTIDLMNAVAEKQGMTIEFVSDTWSNTLGALRDRKIDAVTGMMYSTERDKIFDFSIPHVIISYALFKQKETPIRSVDDVKNRDIIVVEDVFAQEWLIEHKITDSIISVNSPTEALRLLASGSHDCAIIPRLHGLNLIEDLGINNVETTGSPLLGQKFSFAVSGGNADLLAQLNEGIFSLQQSGTYDQIYLKWFSVSAHIKHDRKTMYLVLFFVFVCVLLLLAVLFWNRSLKRAVGKKTKELRQNEIRLTQIIDGIPIPTFVINKDREVTHWNKACELLTGETSKKIVGTSNHYKALHDKQSYSIVDLLMDNALTKSTQQHDRSLYRESGILKGAYETEIYRSSLGISGRWLYGSAVLLRDETGKLNGGIETWQDLTESKQLERQLIQSQKMEAIGTLAGGIAHDFNNILTGIMGHVELALPDLPPKSPVRNHLEHILTAVARANHLVNQILTFSRQAEIGSEPVQIRPIVEETLTLIRTTLPANIEVHQDLQSDSVIMADSTHVHQIIMNLCTNAVQAMSGTGGVLSVQLSDTTAGTPRRDSDGSDMPGHYLELTISDTGHGIPLEIKDKILDPFFTTKKRGEGTGMGLSVTHGIVKQYGGKLTFDSESGSGTVFRVYLPIANNDIPVSPEDGG